MSDADKSLEILIKTKADLKDAIALREELDRSILRSKLLGKSFADQQASLNRVNGAIKQFTGGLNESGKETKLFAGHAGEVKKAVRELGEQFPVASKALMFFANPVGGTIAIAIGMFTYMKQALDDWNKEMDETSERLAKPDFIDAINARKDAFVQGEIAAEQFADKMENLIDPEERYQKAVQESISLLQQQAAATTEVADAQNALAQSQLGHNKNLEQNRLKQQLAAGKITIEQFNADKLAIDAAYLAQLTALEIQHKAEQLAREKQLRDDILKLDQAALEHAQKVQPGLNAAASSARGVATTSAAALAKAQAQQSAADAQRADDLKTLNDITRNVLSMLHWHANFRDLTESDLTPDKLRSISGALEISPAEKDQIKALLDARNTQALDLRLSSQASTRLPGFKVDASLAEAAAARAEARAEANQQRIQDAQDKIDEAKQANATKDAADQGAAEAQAQKALTDFRDKQGSASIDGGFTIADEERFEQMRDQMQHGGRINSSQQAFFTGFANYVNSQILYHTKAGEDLARLSSVTATAVEKLKAQDDLLRQLEARIKDIKNP